MIVLLVGGTEAAILPSLFFRQISSENGPFPRQEKTFGLTLVIVKRHLCTVSSTSPSSLEQMLFDRGSLTNGQDSASGTPGKVLRQH